MIGSFQNGIDVDALVIEGRHASCEVVRRCSADAGARRHDPRHCLGFKFGYVILHLWMHAGELTAIRPPATVVYPAMAAVDMPKLVNQRCPFAWRIEVRVHANNETVLGVSPVMYIAGPTIA